MRKSLRAIAFKVAPGLAERFFAGRQRRHIDRLVRQWDLPRINQLVLDHFHHRIAAGPFQGMQYAGEASGSMTAPKVIGSYEAEIAPWIDWATRAGFDRAIDVGCAEGYYAVGMAWKTPTLDVIAYDIDPLARQRCAELAELNGVSDRVSVRARCDAAGLASVLTDHTFILCDVEGYEDTLLDPAAVPGLRRATLLVELHDHFVAGLTGRLKARFASTHDWAEVASADRIPSDYPHLDFLPVSDRPHALSERRPGPQAWALLTPR